MVRKLHDMYYDEKICNFISDHVHHLPLGELRERLIAEFPYQEIASRSSLGRYVKDTHSDQQRFTRWHAFFRNDATRNFVNRMSKQQVSIDGILSALTQHYPDRKLPGRGALQRYLISVGRSGRRNNWSQYPAAQTFLQEADPGLSIMELRKGLAKVLPANKVPGKSAISRYFVGNGGKAQRATFFFKPVCAAIIRMVHKDMTVKEIGIQLTSIFPDAKMPARSTLARHVKEVRDGLKQTRPT